MRKINERYVVRDHEAGLEIDGYMTVSEAINAMERYVDEDKKAGLWTANFYEVYDRENESIIAVSE